MTTNLREPDMEPLTRPFSSTQGPRTQPPSTEPKPPVAPIRRRRRRRPKQRRTELGLAEWKKTRAYIKQRDNHACVRCGSTYRLSVHHVTPARYGGGNDEGNLATMCSRCHNRADAAFRAMLRYRA